MAKIEKIDAAQDAHPGMMGDGTEEQNLGQTGDPGARITEDEVTAAFETEQTPTTRRINPAPKGEKVDHLADKVDQAESRQEALIDESLDESFPASDPPSAKHIT
jgi:hypothetical protein